ncbi:MAG: BrnT family toxin [Pirellulales bacterium]|nr:BrnT family toxin [Pirellulales bacterium]
MTAGRPLLVVVYTERNDRLRLVSARMATNSERKTHEEDA